MTDSVDAFAKPRTPGQVAICDRLRAVIDANLPQARSKLWHAIPVWFVGENAVVGYDVRKTGIVLMFWNGQNFQTPGLEASGSFHVGQILYTDASQIDEAQLKPWLDEAGTNIWDMVGERRAFVAKRKAKKSRAAKPKVRVKPRSKAKAKVGATRPRKAARPLKKPARRKK
jgi:hypothetical protein